MPTAVKNAITRQTLYLRLLALPASATAPACSMFSVHACITCSAAKVAHTTLLYEGQDSTILQLSSGLVDKACKAAPGSPQYAVEAGYQALLAGDMQGALTHYSRASHLHELDMEAMYGSIECDLLLGKVCHAPVISTYAHTHTCLTWVVLTHLAWSFQPDMLSGFLQPSSHGSAAVGLP